MRTIIIPLILAVFTTAAGAAPIVFYNDSSLTTPATYPNLGASGSQTRYFGLDSATDDLLTVSIDLDIGTVDEGTYIQVNGTAIVDITRMDTNSGGPVGMTPGLNQPWTASGTGPRAIFTLTSSGVTLEGLINSGDVSYTSITITAPVTNPVFVDGMNSIVVTNRNVSGPGGTTGWALAGTVNPIPEPSTIAVICLGCLGLIRRSRR